MRGLAGVVASLSLLLSPLSHAGRPLATEDADLMTAGACEVETWFQRTRESTQWWLMPACNPTGAFELHVGGVVERRGGQTALAEEEFQVKVQPLRFANGMALGLVAGTVRHRRSENPGWPGDAYAIVPLSITVIEDVWNLHLNGGVIRRHDEGRHVRAWAIGNEVRVARALELTPEVFRFEDGRAFYQVGVRWSIVPDRFHFDATYGARFGTGSQERWWTVGLRYETPILFP